MCNISKKTRRKTVTVYKVAVKFNDSYRSPFTFKKLILGKVKPLTELEAKTGATKGLNSMRYFDPTFQFYNWNMLGKTSGFYTKRAAKEVFNHTYGLIHDLKATWGLTAVILKVTLGGEIWEGSAKRICEEYEKDRTFAGTEILSMEEIE